MPACRPAGSSKPGCPTQFIGKILKFSFTYLFCRNSSCDHKLGNIFCYYSSCAHNSALSDFDPGEYYRSRSDKYIISDFNRACGCFKSGIVYVVFRIVDHNFACNVNMITDSKLISPIENCILPNYRILSNPYVAGFIKNCSP